MRYTTLGRRTGLRVSVLGFGAMRLPMNGQKVDYDQAVPLMQRAFELGVNYIDSAVGYCNRDSQTAIGMALKGWRDQVTVCTKNPSYDRNQHDAFWRNLEESLRKLGVDCIDLYKLHGLNWERFENHVSGKGGSYEWLVKAREQGLIRHVGFSFHDSSQALAKIARTGLFDAVTCQYNLLDRSNAGAFAAVKEQGMGIVVMGPVGGGRLGAPSEALRQLLPGAASVPEIALRFVLANPHVDVAISGMSELQHIEENCRVADRRTALTRGEVRKVEATLKRYKKLADLYCTGCKYCMPCPHGVNIPLAFDALNQDRVYGLGDLARKRYNWTDNRASLCLACGQCMSKCPQHIDIIAQLRESVRRLDDAYGKLAVRLLPGRLNQCALRDGTARVELTARIECANVSDQPARPRITLAPARGVRLRVGRGIGELMGFERRAMPVTLTTRVGPDRPVRLGLQVDSELELCAAAASEVQLLPARPGGVQALNLGPKAHLRLADPAFRTPAAVARHHAAAVTAAYDRQALYLRVMIRDDMTCLPNSGLGRWVELGDRIELELDLSALARPQGQLPPKLRWQALIGLPEASTGKCPVAFLRPRPQSAKEMQITPTPVRGGLRLDLRLPWTMLTCPPGRRGGVLGFNLAHVSHNARGKVNLRRQWAAQAGWILLA